MTRSLSPSKILFTQDSISDRFSDGNFIEYVISKIISGEVTIDEIEKIKVFTKSREYYSIDNRRLYMFKELQRRKYPDLKVQVKLIKHCPPGRFTTRNGGKSIRVRKSRVDTELCAIRSQSMVDREDDFIRTYPYYQSNIFMESALITPVEFVDIPLNGNASDSSSQEQSNWCSIS